MELDLTNNDVMKIVVAINTELEELDSSLSVIEKDLLLCDNSDTMLDLLCNKDIIEQNIYQYKQIIKKLGWGN